MGFGEIISSSRCHMLKKSVLVMIAIIAPLLVEAHRASDSARVALTGLITSKPEGRMEGVLVSAKGEGSSVTVTVVSNKEGRYAFPVDRLKPGKYHLSARATRYDLDDPGLIEVVSGKSKSAVSYTHLTLPTICSV